MEQLTVQMRVLADELNVLKTEFITIKGSHASMHQATVDSNTASA